MTDPEFADRTYIEPVTPEYVERIIERERPDAILPTMGGQTALNVAMALAENGVLERYGVELIGANARAISDGRGPPAVRRGHAPASGSRRRPGRSRRRGTRRWRSPTGPGFPAIIRPSFTLGGSGGGIAYNRDEYEAIVRRGLDLSPTSAGADRALADRLEGVRARGHARQADNVVIVCSIENLDPMGVHTGDSITVAPAMTLTDREYQPMRDAACAIIREIGVEAGGLQHAVRGRPAHGDMVVIEMNPRVSRSSALASKATGFPIARIGAKLAVGYRLDEIPNDITRHDARVVRAGARLRRREVPALRVREVPRRRPAPHDADEERRREHGDRAHVQGGVPEGAARARDRRAGLGGRRDAGGRPARRTTSPEALRAGAAAADAGADLPDQAGARSRASRSTRSTS